MTDRHQQQDKLEAQLQRAFQRLRQDEQNNAPDFPGAAATDNVVSLPLTQRRPYRTLPQMAAAVAVLAVGMGYFMQVPQEDPAALYSDIMSGQSMQTDALMQISSSVLPAVYDVPQLYDANFSYDTNSLLN